MNFWSLSLLILVVLEVILLVYLRKKYQHTPSINYYSWVVVSVIAWVFLNTLLAFDFSVKINTIINKLTFVAGAFIPTTLWLFSYSFPWLKKKLFPNYIYTAILIPVVFSLLILGTNLIVGFTGLELEVGQFFELYVLYFIYFMAWSVKNLIQTYKEQNPFYRKIIFLLLIGIIASAVIGITSELILPWVGIVYSKPFYGWIGSTASVFWLIFTTKVLMTKE